MSTRGHVDVSADKRGINKRRDERLRVTKRQKKKGGRETRQAGKRCSGAAGAVWFRLPGPTARYDAYPPHSLTKQPQSLPSERPQTLHIEYIQNQSHLSPW